MKLAYTIVAAIALLASGCNKNASKKSEDKPPEKSDSKPSSHEADAHTDEPEHEGIPKRVRIAPAVVKDAKITVAPSTREALPVTLLLPGELTADPDRSARVASPVSGRLDRVTFQEGTTVKKGDVLAIVRVPELGKVRSAHAATAAKGAAARANADRLQALADKKLASAQEALSARAEADALDVEARALAEQLQAMGTGEAGGGPQLALRAPVTGVVVSRDAVVGQPITPEQTIAQIADLSVVLFLGRLFEKDLGRVKLGARAEVQVNAYPKETFEGSIEYITQKIDPVARTVTARIRLANRDQLLRIGLFGSARVGTGEAVGRPARVVVPHTAVVEIAGKSVVFVRQADDDYELHEVVLGESALGKTEIINGLREGEQVVVDGAFTLKSVALKSTLAEDD